MMLVIAGSVEIDPANMDAAIEAGKVMMAATRAEAGNIAYVFSADFETPGVIRIFEQWESQEALSAHFQVPHMAVFQKQLGELGVKNLEVQRYEISSVGPLTP